ncbi:MAG: hypothetical protein M3430_09510 [Acidobacteriota bacterium]|nr:hypothetical protein [Acidobacteriota bacterium]
MSFRRLLLTTLLLLSGATFINAQENKCTLKINQAPELRGFRLGMTLEQTKGQFPFVRVQVSNKFDFHKQGWVTADDLKENANFKGVEGLSLTFLDDKLIEIGVNYDNSIEWKSEEHFSTRVGEMLKLPNAWQRSLNTGYARQLECDGFQVRTRVNQINLFNPVEYQNLERRQQEQVERKKEERRQSFKP